MRLEGKVAIVTGGAGGIGWKTCELLAREGAKVVVADILEDAAERLAASIQSVGGQAVAVKVDVTRMDEAERLANAALDAFGCIDILANIAGGSAGVFLKSKLSLFAESNRERWEEIVNLNLYGTLNCSRAVINHMIERRTGKIVSLSSTAGMIGMQRAAEYSAAQAGIIGFTKTLAKEVGSYGIHVNCISPGIIGTERVRQMPRELVRQWHEGIPLGRLGKPEEVAGVVLFLSSSESDYVTGVNIPVTGGLTLGPKGY